MSERYYVRSRYAEELSPARFRFGICDRRTKTERGWDAYVGKEFEREGQARTLCDRMNADQKRLDAFYARERGRKFITSFFK